VADDIAQNLRIPASRLYVAHPGPSTGRAATAASESELAALLGVVPEYLIYAPSPPRPHKNLDRLLHAIARLPECVHVAATGYPTEHVAGFLALAARLGLASRVHWLGWVDDGVVEALYRRATCVVFPSLTEGFGLPVLEAMARGVPVACSNRSSLPELRADLALRARTRSERFTWAGCARATLRCYAAVTAPPRGRR
jgi:glycosyltransferase involved in cell wall biosynthesis